MTPLRQKGDIIMIRSVSRFAVEINKPDSPYFERVICFVRPQYAENGSINLHRAALECIEGINENVECSSAADASDAADSENPFFERILGLPRWVLMAGAAVLGSVFTILGAVLIF